MAVMSCGLWDAMSKMKWIWLRCFLLRGVGLD